MMFLHVADLHVSVKEKEYSLKVWGEILRIAKEEQCRWILICGDLFDSWEDLTQLREEVRNMARPYASHFQIFFIPGNHEVRKVPQAMDLLKKLDLGEIQVLAASPYSLHSIDPAVELLAIPFSQGPLSVEDWGVPPKKSRYRLLAAHGMVPGVVYQGEGEEELGALDLASFQRFEIDYAALGHLHNPPENQNNPIPSVHPESHVGMATLPREEQHAPIPFVYPGSGRVWRAGEEGPRSVVIWELEMGDPGSMQSRSQTKGVSIRRRVLESAGRFIPLEVEVSLDGNLQEPPLPGDLGRADWIQLELVGITEDERKTREQVDKFRARLEKGVRKVTVDSTKLEWIEGLSSHPLAQRFLSVWEEQYREALGQEKDILRYARLHGLRAIQELRGGRS